MKISNKQERRLWAIGGETGFSRLGIFRVVQSKGFPRPSEVTRDEYDEIIGILSDPRLVAQWSQDPNTLDLFDS